MAQYKLKLNSTLTFNEDEADIYAMVASLAERHKLTDMLNSLLRIYYSQPEKFNGIPTNNYVDKHRIEYLAELKRSNEAKNHELCRKLDWLCRRVITLEDKLTELYSLSGMNKLIGMPERVQATYSASIILRNELRKLSEELNHPVPERSGELEESSERLLAYTIEHYDGVLSELKQLGALIQQPVMMPVAVTTNGGTQEAAVTAPALATTSAQPSTYGMAQPQQMTPGMAPAPMQTQADVIQQQVAPDIDAALDMFGDAI